MLMLLSVLLLISPSLGGGFKGCRLCFVNEDFRDGTFRIRKPGKYCLCEDIEMNPDPGDISRPNAYGAWFPTNEKAFPGSTTHTEGGFALGYFAAISIESSNVELDLNGYEIRMHRHFYIQQRFYNHIEVQQAPFIAGQGPTSFGNTVRLNNIYIHNGKLGLSSHNGIHGFDVDNLVISELDVYDFEVCGVQVNGFDGLTIKNVHIGPSATDVPFWGYYSHGRFSLNGLELIKDIKKKFVKFNGGRKLTLQQIYNNLQEAMDIAFRYEIGEATDHDRSHPDFHIIMELFNNPFRIPDGSTLYGILLNSKGLAVQGFGSSPNDEYNAGRNVVIDNVKIDGLYLNVNEVPVLYFDGCDGHYLNIDGSLSITPVLGRFGDAFDVRKALPYDDWNNIDKGFGDDNNGYGYHDIYYHGNVLSDAQVALEIFSGQTISNWGLGGDQDSTRGKTWFRAWATDESKHDSLPKCARFVCNGDVMFHTNKGIVGIRMDGIENVEIHDVSISNLYNESPLASMACGRYDGPLNGAQPNSLNRDGYMGTDIRGISIINGGECDFDGSIEIDNLISNYGDVIGIHVMDDARLYFNKDIDMDINNCKAGASVSSSIYDRLKDAGKVPYPNNFFECNIKTEQRADRKHGVYPYDQGRKTRRQRGDGKGYVNPFLPNGVDEIGCRNIYDD